MSEIINASVDISQFTDAEIVTKDKNGNLFKNGAKYINISIMVNDTANQWGKNVSVSKPQSKEERQTKARKTFVGQGVSVWRNGETLKWESTEKKDDSLPF